MIQNKSPSTNNECNGTDNDTGQEKYQIVVKEKMENETEDVTLVSEEIG